MACSGELFIIHISILHLLLIGYAVMDIDTSKLKDYIHATHKLLTMRRNSTCFEILLDVWKSHKNTLRLHVCSELTYFAWKKSC